MKFVKIIFALLVVAALFKFNLDNKESVSVIFYEYTTPLIPAGLLLMTTFVLGMIAASFASTLKIVQLKRQISKLQPESSSQNDSEKKRKKEKKKKTEVQEKPADVPQENTVSTPVEVATPPVDEAVSDAVYEEDSAEEEKDEAVQDVIELPMEAAEPTQPDEKKE